MSRFACSFTCPECKTRILTEDFKMTLDRKARRWDIHLIEPRKAPNKPLMKKGRKGK